MIRANKKTFRMLAVVLCAIAIVGGFYAITASAEEINDTNPELTLAEIDSDVEIDYHESEYVQTTNYKEGDGKYILSSDAYVAWYTRDDIAFAYKKYNVSNKIGDYAEATVTVDKWSTSKARHMNASVGLMFRSGLEATAPEVFLHLRGNSVVVVYRTDAGDATYVQRTGLTVQFPAQLRMRKEFNSVKMQVKSANSDTWLDIKYPVGLMAPGPLYIGVAVHSCEEGNVITGEFSNFQVTGVGTYAPGEQEDDEANKPPEEYVEEDAPASPDVMLRETFSDGDLTNTPESVTNPVWTDTDNIKIINEDGNRVLENLFVNQNNWIGNWTDDTWTNDYEVSVDVRFSELCNPDPEAATNTFRLYARHMPIEIYGRRQYAAVVKNGYNISLNKYGYYKGDSKDDGETLVTVNLREFLQDEDYSCLGDGIYHTLKMKAFDNTITIYWDGQKVIEYTDTTDAILTFGNVGIGAYQVAVHVDNLTVVRLEDAFGGEYDNEIGGNWNLPIPDYVKYWDDDSYNNGGTTGTLAETITYEISKMESLDELTEDGNISIYTKGKYAFCAIEDGVLKLGETGMSGQHITAVVPRDYTAVETNTIYPVNGLKGRIQLNQYAQRNGTVFFFNKDAGASSNDEDWTTITTQRYGGNTVNMRVITDKGLSLILQNTVGTYTKTESIDGGVTETFSIEHASANTKVYDVASMKTFLTDSSKQAEFEAAVNSITDDSEIERWVDFELYHRDDDVTKPYLMLTLTVDGNEYELDVPLNNYRPNSNCTNKAFAFGNTFHSTTFRPSSNNTQCLVGDFTITYDVNKN